MHPDPIAILRDRFGYPSFRPGQEDLVRAVLGGRDALGVLPTGGGKSICYQVPAFALGGLTLVITPLVSLMEDQVGRAREVGLHADSLSGTQTPELRREVRSRALSGGTDILFVSPERLEVDAFRTLLARFDVRLLAVDEAHCISEWGHDFRPAYRRIARIRRVLRCPTLALTASATPEVRRDIIGSLELTRPLEVVRSFDRPNLWWSIIREPDGAARTPSIYTLLRRTTGAAIVYAPTRRAVERFRDALARRGLRTLAYHAGVTGRTRSDVQERFMSGETRVVVATNAFGMGIDKADVRVVVHLQLPTTLEAYYQEAGRAGRDGAPSTCVAFFTKRDRALGDRFTDRTHPPVLRLQRLHRALRRGADDRGMARVDASAVLRLLGGRPDGWLSGEPEGPLAALERIGAIRRLTPPPSAQPPGWAEGGSVPPSMPPPDARVGVRSSVDWRSAARHRRRAQAKLEAVVRFARTRGCRRRALLRYFGEDSLDDCCRCDRCGWDVSRGPRRD